MSIVILRSTGPQNNPGHFTPEFCERLRVVDPVAYATDVCAEFADPESGLLSPVAVRENTRRSPVDLNRTDGSAYAAAIDPGANRYTVVITEWPRGGRYRVAHVREWMGEPEACLREAARDCLHYGVTTVVTDQFAGAVHAALARKFGIALIEQPWTSTNRIEQYSNLATLIHAGEVELHPDPKFQRDLLAVRRRVSQSGGFNIILPRTGDGRHCDYAPALVAAINALATAPRPLTHAEVRANHQQAAMLNRLSGGFDHWEVDDAGQLVHLIHA